MDLSKPYNLLMPFKGHRLVVTVHHAIVGDLHAHLAGAVETTAIQTTRLLTTRVDGRTRYPHTDVTRSQPRAMLDGFIAHGVLFGRQVEFKSRGRGRHVRDQIHIAAQGASII